MTEIEPDIAHLDAWPIVLPCESPVHAEGVEGCMPGTNAEFIIEKHHPGYKGEQMLICGGHLIWLRGRLLNTVTCPSCHKPWPLAAWFTYVGPIEEKKS